MKHSVLVSFVLLAGLPAALAASVTVPVGNQIPWSIGSGSFGRAVPGRFVAGFPMGVVQMRAGYAVLLPGPGVTSTTQLVLDNLNDVATVRGNGTTDALAVVADGTSLRVGGYDETTGAWSFHNVSIGAWSGAKLVRSADLDASGSSDLLGVGSDRRTILIATFSGSAFNAQTGFSIGYDVLDLQPLEWSTSSGLEIAVLSTWGLEVYDQSGTRLWWRATPQSGTTMAVLPEDPTVSGDRDALVYVTKGASGPNQYLLVSNDGGTQSPVALGDAKIVRIATGDGDDDGDADAFCTHRDAQTIRRFRNDGGTTWFSTSAELGAVSVGDPSAAATNTNGLPLVLDLDGDAEHAFNGPGDNENDLYFASDDAGFAVFYPAVAAYIPASPPASGYDYPSGEHSIFAGAMFCRGTTSSVATIKLALTNGWYADSATTDATHLEIVVWADSDDIPAGQNIVNESEAHVYYTEASGVDFFGSASGTGRIEFQVGVPAALSDSLSANIFHEKFYLTVRPIQVDSSDNVVRVWRNAIGSFTGDFEANSSQQYPHFQALMDLTGAWQGAVDTTACGGDSGTTPGGFVPRTQLPPLPSPVVVKPKATGSHFITST